MVTHIMSDAIEAAANAIKRAARLHLDKFPALEMDYVKLADAALTAYEAAKGEGVPYLWVYESPGYFNPATGGEPPYTDFSDVEKPGYFPLYRALTSPASEVEQIIAASTRMAKRLGVAFEVDPAKVEQFIRGTSPASGERDAVIDECAGVADAEAEQHRTNYRNGGRTLDHYYATAAENVAAAIRALRMEGK